MYAVEAAVTHDQDVISALDGGHQAGYQRIDIIMDREAAAKFNQKLNGLLARKAREYTGRNRVRVLLAGGIYNHPYAVDEVSGLDCFHPSRSGQAYLGNLVWPAIYDALIEPDCSADGYCNPDCRRSADPDCKKGKGPGKAQ